MSENKFIQTDASDGLLMASVLTRTLSEYELGVVFADIADAAPSTQWKIIVDCSKVTMLASAGIGMFVKLQKRCAENSGRLAVCGLNDDIMGVLKLTRMDRVFTITDTTDQAAASFG